MSRLTANEVSFLMRMIRTLEKRGIALTMFEKAGETLHIIAQHPYGVPVEVSVRGIRAGTCINAVTNRPMTAYDVAYGMVKRAQSRR